MFTLYLYIIRNIAYGCAPWSGTVCFESTSEQKNSKYKCYKSDMRYGSVELYRSGESLRNQYGEQMVFEEYLKTHCDLDKYPRSYLNAAQMESVMYEFFGEEWYCMAVCSTSTSSLLLLLLLQALLLLLLLL